MTRFIAPLFLVVFALVPLGLKDPYLLNALIITGILTICAMSLNLLLGFTGQLSLGHVAFFGIGAYVSALTALGFDVSLPLGLRITHEGGSPLLGFVLAVGLTGLCGYLIGRLSFRVRGAYFVIVTISFAEVVRLVALNWVELTQGPLALTAIPNMVLPVPGLGDVALRSKMQNYYLVLAVAAVGYLIIGRVVGSRFGPGQRGLEGNEGTSQALRGLGASTPPARSRWRPQSPPRWRGRRAASMPITSASSIRTCSCSPTPSPWSSWWCRAARARWPARWWAASSSACCRWRSGP